jgi:hypothetical protein
LKNNANNGAEKSTNCMANWLEIIIINPIKKAARK